MALVPSRLPHSLDVIPPASKCERIREKFLLSSLMDNEIKEPCARDEHGGQSCTQPSRFTVLVHDGADFPTETRAYVIVVLSRKAGRRVANANPGVGGHPRDLFQQKYGFERKMKGADWKFDEETGR